VAVVGVWIMMRATADEWWLSTILLFGPSWVWALPLIGLVPLAAVFRFRSLGVLFLGALVAAGPLMGFCLPWRQMLPKDKAGLHFRILTCNVDHVFLDAPAMARVLEELKPDIVSFQEWKEEHERPVFGNKGWHVRSGGGVCLGSRFPILHVQALQDEPGWRDVITRYDLDTPAGLVHFFNVHLETPRAGLEAILGRRFKGIPDLEANIALRNRESEMASRWVRSTEGPLIVAGDFNMSCGSRVFRRWWDDYSDAFTIAGFGPGYSKYTEWFGVRIDHVLTGPGWECRRCWVGPDVHSDHRPVIADLEWVGSIH
jgi:endonuclease/exonuclease/phosphatase (EEP) superfamily protein YafD